MGNCCRSLRRDYENTPDSDYQGYVEVSLQNRGRYELELELVFPRMVMQDSDGHGLKPSHHI